MAFILEKGGLFRDVRAVKTCAFPMLNEAAVHTVERAARFRPLPGNQAREEWRVVVPIDYRLEN